MKKAKQWLAAMLVAGMAAGAVAAEVRLDQAETAVGNWIARGGAFGRLSGGVELSGESFEDPDTGAKMHVVRVPGKGFAVTSADDGIEPIILFSEGDGDFAAEAGNPLWDLLRWDLAGRRKAMEEETKLASHRKGGGAGESGAAARAKWAELLSGGGEGGNRTLRAANGKRVISEIRRVLPMTTLWNQRDNSRGEQAYNLYSPRKPAAETEASATARGGTKEADSGEDEGEQSPCGCVATAGGQVMKYLKWPTGAVEARQGDCEVWGAPRTLTMKGGPYRWDAMGTVEPSGAECEEVSKLTYDIGVACGASFSNETSMSAEVLVGKMTSVFRYANAVWRTFDSFEPDTFEQGVTTSLDAGVPLLLSLRKSASSKGGHTVVVDGCGKDDGKFAVHINCGWGAKDYNLWYIPPSIHPADGYEYDFVSGFGYNFFAGDTGSVVSGIVRGPNGRAVTGGSVSWSGPAGVQGWSSKARGVAGCYALCAPPGSYTLRASADGAESAEYRVEPKTCTRGVMGNVLQDIVIPGVKTVAAVAATTTGAGDLAKAVRDTEDTTFASSFKVTLSSATPGTEIRYTLDGTQPGPESAVYEGEIAIQDTTTLRAVAYADGMECSEEFRRTWTFEDPQSRDNFADARPISGASGKSSFNNAGYTKEAGEPTHSSKGTVGGASAWAVWTAPAAGDWTFRLSGVFRDYPDEDMDTQLAVYSGNSVSNLVRVVANDDANRNEEDYSSRLSFTADAGTTYHIAMDSYRGATYPGTLTLEWEEGWVDWAQFEYTPQWVPVSGGEWGMEVEASANWNVTDHSDWIEPVAYSGEAGGRISYRVATNSTGSERTGYVTVQAGNSGFTSLAVRQHTQDFVTTKEAALDRAWRENKRIFIIYGREGCYYTRTTMFSTLVTAGVRALLDEGYVLWYSNCDRQSDARSHVSPYSAETLPTLAIVDPLDPDGSVAGLGGYQSASAIQSLLQSAPAWEGLPPALVDVSSVSSDSAKVTAKVRAWGSGASGATVTLETAGDAEFAGAVSTRPLGTITEIWTEQEWTFGPPSATEAAFCRVRVASGDWSVVSDVVEFIPLGIALDNGTLAFVSEGAAAWFGQTKESHDGADAAACVIEKAAGTNNWAESSLKTTVQGPARLSFWWKGGGNYGYLRLRVDGTLRKTMAVTNQVWEEASWSFSDATSHEVEWVLQRYNYDRPYYNVTGWVDQVTCSRGDIVTLDFQGGYSSQSTVVASRGEAMPPVDVPTQRGYTFGGYFSETNGMGVQYYTASGTSARDWDRTGEATLYAKWTPGTYTVTLDRQGGTGGTASVTATYGEKLPSVEIPACEGLDFAGYFDRTGGTGTQYYNVAGKGTRRWDVAGNATLYAHWVDHIPTVVVDGVVYSADMTTLVLYPEEKEGALFVVPASVTNLAPGCFAATQLRAVQFPGNAPTATDTCFASGLLGYCTKGTAGWTDESEDEAWGARWNGIRMYPIPEGGVETLRGKDYRYEMVDGIVWVFVVTNGEASLEYKPSQSGGWGHEACIPWGVEGEVVVPSELGGCPVTRIGDSALSCGSYTSVVIPHTVGVIASDAFCYNGNQLKSVTIPNSVTNIGVFVFACSSGLEEILVESGNPCYESDGGVLYTLGKGSLVEAPPALAGHFDVPGMVTNIGRYAFCSCDVTSIAIPDSVVTIGGSAFYWCYDLARIEVPASWYGMSGKLAGTGLSSECEVVYRGIFPLAVATETLPAGTAGTAYRAVLEATGGVAPYAWSEAVAPHAETSAASTYAAVGTAKGWQADDRCWDLALPFAFPYFGESYTNAKVNSNGTLSFGEGSFTDRVYSESTFKAAPVIAVMWKDLDTADGDIYVESGEDAVTVRWMGAYYSYSGDGGAVNFAVTLHRDGKIVFSYGPGNASGGFIGLSAGDGRTTAVSAKSSSGSMENADDIVFTPPADSLPPGLELTADGVLRGTPTVPGTHAFAVAVTDAKGVRVSKELSLAVEDYGGGPATSGTPVPVPHAWLAGYGLGDGTSDGFEAAANAAAANGMPVWACYVAGLSPADPGARFTARISLADGKPALESVSPDLVGGRSYILVGKKDLMDGEWADLTDNPAPAADGYRFFGAAVSLPK